MQAAPEILLEVVLGTHGQGLCLCLHLLRLLAEGLLKPGSAGVHAPKAPNLKRSLLAISGAIRFDLAISCWNVACTELAALSSLEGSSTKN